MDSIQKKYSKLFFFLDSIQKKYSKLFFFLDSIQKQYSKLDFFLDSIHKNIHSIKKRRNLPPLETNDDEQTTEDRATQPMETGG